MTYPFTGFPKIARLSREIVITEKIDGTNAQVFISESGEVLAGSRTRWITPEADNYGFAAWVKEHEEELRTLGPGSHFGEWWGKGIQRNYGLQERRFSLFNQDTPLPACCHRVPVLYRGPFSMEAVDEQIAFLKGRGSLAAPGFMNAEGVIVFHTAGNVCFKKTILKDEERKGNHGV